MVLQGFGKMIRDVKAVILESSFVKNYKGAVDFKELHSFMVKNGFQIIWNTYNNSASIPRKPIKAFLNRYVPDFNCIYIKTNL